MIASGTWVMYSLSTRAGSWSAGCPGLFGRPVKIRSSVTVRPIAWAPSEYEGLLRASICWKSARSLKRPMPRCRAAVVDLRWENLTPILSRTAAAAATGDVFEEFHSEDINACIRSASGGFVLEAEINRNVIGHTGESETGLILGAVARFCVSSNGDTTPLLAGFMGLYWSHGDKAVGAIFLDRLGKISGQADNYSVKVDVVASEKADGERSQSP